MHSVEEATQMLREHGLKITERRIAMLEALFEEEKHLSAREVTEKMVPEFPGISPDTIYRNLHTFSELGIIGEIEFEGEKYFHAHRDFNSHHHHFICTECGRSILFEMCPLKYFEDQLEDVLITSHRFELFGLCPACRKKNESLN